MGALDTLRRWLSPILDPFSNLPTHLNNMQQNHLSSLDTYQSIVASLMVAPVSQKFSGPAAEKAIQYVEDFLRAERSISGAGSAVDEVSISTQTCVTEVEVATEILAGAAEDESLLIEVTEGVDIVSVAQGGLDPLTDIPGIILTVIVGALIISQLVDFGQSIYQAVQSWIKAMHQANNAPYSPVPTINDGQGGNKLTADQEEMAQKLFDDYAHLGLSLDDIRAIIANNPGLTEAQLRALLDKYATVIAKNPNLVQQYGVLAVFQSFIALAAYDPAHGGNYAQRKPVATTDDVVAGIDESMVELGVMEQGKAAWPFTPSIDPSYEATDGKGVKWDVKAYRSVDTNNNPFDAEKAVKKMQKDFDKGEKVILDHSRLTPEEIQKLHKELQKTGHDGDVIWWPDNPRP